MLKSNVPSNFWLEAITTTKYLTKNLPTKILNYETPLNTPSIRIFCSTLHNLPPRDYRCIVYVHLPENHRNKLEPRIVKCEFVGYKVDKRGYR